MHRNYLANSSPCSFCLVDFKHFEILRAIGKGAFGKVSHLLTLLVIVSCDYHVTITGVHSQEEGHKRDVRAEVYEQDTDNREEGSR